MTVKNCYDPSKRQWDRFKTYHHVVGNNHSIIQFDTGELIFMAAQSGVGYRREYREIDVRLDTTADLKSSLYDPQGREIKRAWFPSTEHLLVDYSTSRVVSTEGPRFTRSSSEMAIRQGVPERFQKLAQVYIGGEGQLPVPASPIRTALPHKMVATEEQMEHFDMLHSTFKAVARLDDSIKVGEAYNHQSGMPFDVAMKCQTWQDVSVAHYGQLFHAGIARPTVEFPYLLLEPPVQA